MNIKPDFIIIPLVLQHDHRIRPSDGIVYGVVYWYEHLKDGECRASNDSIAEVGGIDSRTVNAGLNRLEQAGYIQRFYKDKARHIRDRIECLVSFKHSRGPKTSMPKALATEVRGETPGEYARKFFTGDKQVVEEIVAELMKATGGKGEEEIKVEMRKFYTYWTEPNKSGTKVRWELERTFDVKRRLYTWLSRVAERKPRGTNRGGAVI